MNGRNSFVWSVSRNTNGVEFSNNVCHTSFLFAILLYVLLTKALSNWLLFGGGSNRDQAMRAIDGRVSRGAMEVCCLQVTVHGAEIVVAMAMVAELL